MNSNNIFLDTLENATEATSADVLRAAFNSFRSTVTQQVDTTEQYPQTFRFLSDLHIAISSFMERQKALRGKKNVDTFLIAKQSLHFIEREQALLEQRVSHPELFTNYTRTVSDLQWDEKAAPKRGLIELACKLSISKSIIDKSARRHASFRSILDVLGVAFDIDLKYGYKEVRNIRNRKGERTFLGELDKLTDSTEQ